ncbi:hypothetical protein ABZ905_09165 [Streptomyces parvus]|uniref:hypothetical protein n=1 Tax=Streptomyces parvus TaxID=66428 RepID=UPI003400D5DD
MSDLMIAVVGGGGALLGAAVGGAAAVKAATVQARHGQETARLAYEGPIDAARRTAQRAAYARLLTSAHEFHAAATPALGAARLLIKATDARARNEPHNITEQALDRAQAAVAQTIGAAEVVAAAQHVRLEGPPHIAVAANAVDEKAQELAYVFAHAEQIYEDMTGHRYGVEQSASDLHVLLTLAIERFTESASAHLNINRQAPAPRRRLLWRRGAARPGTLDQ